ncbi:hypothetical protein [Sphingomonas phage Carli]|nr:hypothetical protein [Sphingomonas phage Carli]
MRVEFAASHLAAFARRWPCFGDPSGPLAFSFDHNGDLCDVAGDEGLEPGAVLALSYDAAHLAGVRVEDDGPPSLDYLEGLPWPLVEQ